MNDKSDMADKIVKILYLWKNGILIMDEVDVLLHPLKSELNFPIGSKLPIDMSGYRWDLPIHLIDAIFFHTRKCIEEDKLFFEKASKICGYTVDSILSELSQCIEEGFKKHVLQRNPHLVLLDHQFYDTTMRPIMAKWALLWLHTHFIGKVEVNNQNLLLYIQGLPVDLDKNGLHPVEVGLLPDSVKLLNLAQNWVKSILPHVISKINRVSYGLLRPDDIALLDSRTPKSRLVMAVPFVGKDVPSRSSEFAHPDALIGLTILAYRYEGVRLSDLSVVVTQLKQDYSRQIGTREKRPAALIFQNG